MTRLPRDVKPRRRALAASWCISRVMVHKPRRRAQADPLRVVRRLSRPNGPRQTATHPVLAGTGWAGSHGWAQPPLSARLVGPLGTDRHPGSARAALAERGICSVLAAVDTRYMAFTQVMGVAHLTSPWPDREPSGMRRAGLHRLIRLDSPRRRTAACARVGEPDDRPRPRAGVAKGPRLSALAREEILPATIGNRAWNLSDGGPPGCEPGRAPVRLSIPPDSVHRFCAPSTPDLVGVFTGCPQRLAQPRHRTGWLPCCCRHGPDPRGGQPPEDGQVRNRPAPPGADRGGPGDPLRSVATSRRGSWV